MKPRLIPCSNCERYVRCSEPACPFCHAALLQPDVPRSLISALPAPGSAGLSRAAVFAMRTAIAAVVAPAAFGCSGEEGARPRDAEQDVVAAAGASAGGAGGSGAAGAGRPTGAGAAGAGAAGSNGASPGSIALGALPSDDAADAGPDAEPYAPVPIYGGVFPDPMQRARV